jgi:hypothetical protein
MIGAMPVRLRLVVASALMLFTELMLIRWLGANLLHLSYFSNIVLLGSFLGIGLGFLVAKPGRTSPWWFLTVLAGLVTVVLLYPGGVDRTGSDLIYFTTVSEATVLPPEATLALVFVAVAAVMMGPAILVAQCFFDLPRLDAYRFDLIGSLIGTVLFAVLSFLGATPLVWVLIIGAAAIALMPVHRTPLAAASLVLLVGLMAIGVVSGDIWSPYYKIQTTDQRGTDNAGQEYAATLVLANGVPHQAILSIDVRLEQEPFYATPYQRIPDNGVGDVLVVGAGNGSDVALALRNGATSVDAVEIDPRIRDLGVRLHPQQPYADPRVTSYIGDGRAFLHQTDKKYDPSSSRCPTR